jgi:hypothetical protein
VATAVTTMIESPLMMITSIKVKPRILDRDENLF